MGRSRSRGRGVRGDTVRRGGVRRRGGWGTTPFKHEDTKDLVVYPFKKKRQRMLNTKPCRIGFIKNQDVWYIVHVKPPKFFSTGVPITECTIDSRSGTVTAADGKELTYNATADVKENISWATFVKGFEDKKSGMKAPASQKSVIIGALELKMSTDSVTVTPEVQGVLDQVVTDKIAYYKKTIELDKVGGISKVVEEIKLLPKVIHDHSQMVKYTSTINTLNEEWNKSNDAQCKDNQRKTKFYERVFGTFEIIDYNTKGKDKESIATRDNSGLPFYAFKECFVKMYTERKQIKAGQDRTKFAADLNIFKQTLVKRVCYTLKQLIEMCHQNLEDLDMTHEMINDYIIEYFTDPKRKDFFVKNSTSDEIKEMKTKKSKVFIFNNYVTLLEVLFRTLCGTTSGNGYSDEYALHIRTRDSLITIFKELFTTTNFKSEGLRYISKKDRVILEFEVCNKDAETIIVTTLQPKIKKTIKDIKTMILQINHKDTTNVDADQLIDNVAQLKKYLQKLYSQNTLHGGGTEKENSQELLKQIICNKYDKEPKVFKPPAHMRINGSVPILPSIEDVLQYNESTCFKSNLGLKYRRKIVTLFGELKNACTRTEQHSYLCYIFQKSELTTDIVTTREFLISLNKYFSALLPNGDEATDSQKRAQDVTLQDTSDKANAKAQLNQLHGSAPEQPQGDDKCAKYTKLLKVGMPKAAVQQKMRAAGLTDAEIENCLS